MTRPASPNRAASPSRAAVPRSPLYDYMLSGNPSAFWPLDDGPGSTIAREVTGNVQAGTHSGDVSCGLISGIDGRSASYYGGQSSLTVVSRSDLFNPASDLTLECWYSPVLTVQNGSFGIAGFNAVDGGGIAYGLYNHWLPINPTSQLYLSTATAVHANGGLVMDFTPNSPVSTELRPWHHFVLRWVANPAELTCYHDGVAADFLWGGNHPIDYQPGRFAFGYMSDNGQGPQGEAVYRYRGGLQYVALYPRALSDGEIAQRWYLGNGPATQNPGLLYRSLLCGVPSLAAYYPLSETSGSIAQDIRGGASGIHTDVVPGQNATVLGPAAGYGGTSSFTNLPQGFGGAQGRPSTLTLEAWVIPSDITGAAGTILARGDQAANTLNYQLGKSAGDGRVSVVVQLNAITYQWTTTNAALVAGQSSYVSAVLQFNTVPTVVVNGVQANLDNAGTLQTDPSGAPAGSVMRLGATGDTPSQFFAGAIQHAALIYAASPVSDIASRFTLGQLNQGRPSA